MAQELFWDGRPIGSNQLLPVCPSSAPNSEPLKSLFQRSSVSALVIYHSAEQRCRAVKGVSTNPPSCRFASV